MPAIVHTNLHEYLEKAQTAGFAPVYLVHGEEMLYKKALASLLSRMLPGGARDLNYEPLEGTDAQVAEALEKVNTFSLLPQTKVVGLLDSTLFYSQADPAEFLKKAGEAHQRGDFKRASVYLLTLLSRRDLSLEDIDSANRSKALGPAAQDPGEDRWLDEVLAYCRETGLQVPPRSDPAERLRLAVEKGFPKGNHLVITSERIDRRHGLYKAVENQGIVIDCSVPRGEGRADRQAQAAVLTEQAQTLLAATGKNMAPAAFQAMVEMTGFNLRTFSSNLEKLVSYVGARKTISAADVEEVLERTRVDPLYEFTNAVTESNLPAALSFLDSLLNTGEIGHPLPLLSAMVNQARRLLVFRDFLESPQGRAWQPNCTYGQFQARVMPAVREFDRLLSEGIAAWETEMGANDEAGSKTARKPKTKKKGVAGGGDLLMAGPGKSPYPIYLMLQKAEGFPKKRIVDIMVHLQHADRRLKSAAGRPKMVLEEAVIFFCT